MSLADGAALGIESEVLRQGIAREGIWLATAGEADSLSSWLANRPEREKNAGTANGVRAAVRESRGSMYSPAPDRESEDDVLLCVASCGLKLWLTLLQRPDNEFSTGQPRSLTQLQIQTRGAMSSHTDRIIVARYCAAATRFHKQTWLPVTWLATRGVATPYVLRFGHGRQGDLARKWIWAAVTV